MITLSLQQWQAILIKLKAEYPSSVFLIRSKMRETLGFTLRNYEEYSLRPLLVLDFFDDTLETYFRMRYLTEEIIALDKRNS